MAVSGMNHLTILTDDVERTVRFYDSGSHRDPGSSRV